MAATYIVRPAMAATESPGPAMAPGGGGGGGGGGGAVRQ